MNEALIDFLVYYMLYRRHSRVRKELHVRTSFQAVENGLCLQPNKKSKFLSTTL